MHFPVSWVYRLMFQTIQCHAKFPALSLGSNVADAAVPDLPSVPIPYISY